MALILCRSCKREIDSAHPFCPHCQAVNPNAISSGGKSAQGGVDWFSVILMAFLFLVVLDATINGSEREQARAKSPKAAPAQQMSSIKSSSQSSAKAAAAKSEAPPPQQAAPQQQPSAQQQQSQQQQQSPPPQQQQAQQQTQTTTESSSKPSPLKEEVASAPEERAAVSEKISRFDKLFNALDQLLGVSDNAESDKPQ